MTVDKYLPGSFSWAELGTSDSKAATMFDPRLIGEMLPYPTVLRVCALKKKSLRNRPDCVDASAPDSWPGPSAKYANANTVFTTR